MDSISLPMYDLAEVRPATLALLDALARQLTAAGWTAAPRLDAPATHADLLAHWRDPSLALSQSCGLPVVEHLATHVTVVGTFRWTGVSDEIGRYRSLVVVPVSSRATSLRDPGPQRVAVNDPTSLSGWCSLGAVLSACQLDTSPVIMHSGSHLASLRMVAAGEAEAAAIDPATFSLLARHRPEAIAGVRIVCEGPTIPATPIVTRRHPPIALAAIRQAVGRAIGDLGTDHRRMLGIDGFVALTDADYESVTALVGRATAGLPRDGEVS